MLAEFVANCSFEPELFYFGKYLSSGKSKSQNSKINI